MAEGVTKITENELLSFVLDALHRNGITESLPTLEASFPDYPSLDLFRTIVLQQAWVHVCSNQLEEGAKLIEELGESPGKQFYEMWRQTTRNQVRANLYDYLHKQGLLSAQDERNHEILLKITTQYPNTSFVSAQKLSDSPAMKIVQETAKQPQWESIVNLDSDFDENKSMLFPQLFNIPKEPPVESPNYFIGNIALIEAQSPETLKMLAGEEPTLEKLWILHCEHKVTEMEALFHQELDKVKDASQLKCLQFVNAYFKQMNAYEQETLLDILCKYGFFADEELKNFEALLVRVCKGKIMFDKRWWSHTMFPFEDFFKQFAKFCSDNGLYMPFEMFVLAHPEAKQIDLSDVDAPMIHFIWDLWIKRDPSAATLSCLQYIAKSDSTDPVKLWESLPPDSLAPLASFVWNKDPTKFQPDSPEIKALAERLRSYYPLLADLVQGKIPHPESGPINSKPSQWRSPIWTSKYDLELHDLIASHFQYDFSKVFTDYYGKAPGQPPFPHFDHPELITTPSEPPYIHYVKALLPVSAFQQTIADNISQRDYKKLCCECMTEALKDKQIRLSALTFIELTDLKFNADKAIDYKICLAVYDALSGDNDAKLIEELMKFFVIKCKESAKSLQQKLAPQEIEPFLLAVRIGVRCKLPLSYAPIVHFARRARPAELLLYLDRAEEIGARYDTDEVVKIVRKEMPENPLKEHLLFHLTQTLPADEGPVGGDEQPALVVFRAIRRTDQPQHVSLLQEALSRKEQLYALLATSIEGSDPMVCALVTLLTMTDAYSFDVVNPPPKPQIAKLFLEVVTKLLLDGKSEDVIRTLELFSETSVVSHISNWYRAVEGFTFRRAEIVLAKVNEMICDKETFEDPLLGTIEVQTLLDNLYPLQDALAKHCVKRSQVHLFRYLQLLGTSKTSTMLKPRVELAKAIEQFENFRRAIMQTDLLGDYDKIVSDLVLHHSIALGQAAATCLGTSAAAATQQWLKFQYSAAETPSQVLEVHSRIASSITDADPLFFVALFASLLPYAQPSLVSEILRFARKQFSDDMQALGKAVDALLLHIKITAEKSIDVHEERQTVPSVLDITAVLFPGIAIPNLPKSLSLAITSPVRYSLRSLQNFFEDSINISIDECLDEQKLADAKLLCEWRHKNVQSILLLEAVQKVVSGDLLSSDDEKLLSSYGSTSNIEAMLAAIARGNGWRFLLISLHFKACKLLDFDLKDLLRHRTTDFLKSQLPMSMDNWDLVRQLISTGKVPVAEVADCLTESFSNCVTGESIVTLSNPLSIDDFGDNFLNFAKLCENPAAVGERLFAKAKQLKNEQSLPVLINLLLHSSLCTSDVDECAEMLDSLLDSLTSEKQLDLIINIVSIFPDPALLPRFFQHLISQNKLDSLPHSKLSAKVGRVIMNCARHVQPFEPKQYFDLTLKYNLYRDHAELQMECGTRLLSGTPSRDTLQEASKHFLLALAYFLHEKCYSLSMECLKKLSLISLQYEVSDPPVLHLEQDRVLRLMCTKDFPFALTVAVAYDMDTETNWAQAIFEQSIEKKGEDFLRSFQFFRPITSNLCNGVVKLFREKVADENMKERMKHFLLNIENLVERYRIAKELEFQDQVNSMKEFNPVVCEWCEKALMNQ